MDITPLVSSDSQIIQSYASGTFKISGQSYEGAVIVYPDRVEPWDFDGDVSALRAKDFEAVLSGTNESDVVLLGGGAKMPFADPALRQAFSDKGMMLEPMDTGAACRTYNVLMAEGRRVLALLLPV